MSDESKFDEVMDMVLGTGKTTYDTVYPQLDKTHRNISAQIEQAIIEKGEDPGSEDNLTTGRRMADSLTLVSLLGHEIDKLKVRIAILEKAQDGEPALN